MGIRRERFAVRTKQRKAFVFLLGIILGSAAIFALRVAPWSSGRWFAASSSASSHGALAGEVVVLDLGHGGIDGGAVGLGGEIVEDDTVLAIALYLRDYLQGAGAYVRLTREGITISRGRGGDGGRDAICAPAPRS